MKLPVWQKALRLLGAYAAFVGAAVVLLGVWRSIAPEDNPFVAADLDDPPGLYTEMKIRRAASSKDGCRALLETADHMVVAGIKDRETGEFCGFENAVALERSTVPYSAPVQLSCPMAVAIYRWENTVLQPAAERHLGQKVARVEHLGSYSCRRVYGGRTGDPSQHARANAIDVRGFRLQDGSEVTVLDHWDGKDDRAAFLKSLHRASCRVFGGVLGPRYNDHHKDHFHLDMGPYRLCR